MRILILSDIHANTWALRAAEQDAGAVDYVLCAGDTVNYGPDPHGAIQWLRERQALVVRGNHDHAVALEADPKASPAKQKLALATRDWTRSVLSPDDLAWLLALPTGLNCELHGTRFAVVHATPWEPLYDYRLTPQAASNLLDRAAVDTAADVLVTGHTHLPFAREHKGLMIVNPGSLGQPLDGDPRAAYAIWEEGTIRLCRVSYDLAPVIDALRRLPLEPRLIDKLAAILREGRIKCNEITGVLGDYCDKD